MDPILRIILSTATDKCTSDKMINAVDVWYEKLLVLPLQRAWRRRPIRSCAYASRVCSDCAHHVAYLRRGMCTECYFLDKYGHS